MKEIYTLKNDIIFKLTFATEDSKERLKEFLKRIYKSDIKEISYIPTILSEVSKENKSKYVDLIVILDNDEVINIEVNSISKINNVRNFCYISNHYVNSIKTGEKYQKIKKHVQINFTWGMSKELKEKEVYKIRNERGNKNYINNFEIIEYNMDKIIGLYYNNSEERKKYKEIIMLGLEPKEIKKLSNGDEFMDEIANKVDDLLEISKKIKWIEPEIENRMIREAELEYAREDGVTEGITKGLLQKTKESAMSFYKNGASKELIMKSLNISLEDLNNILNSG